MGSDRNTGIDKAGYEKQWANRAARLNLSQSDKAVWDVCCYTLRPFVYYNKLLIAWRIVRGEPQVKEVFKVVALDTTFADGIWVRMEAQIAKASILITHTPRKLLDGLDAFGWIPYFNELRFSSGDWDNPDARKSLRLSACFKTRDNPIDRSLIEGQDYLTEVHIFRAKFPQYADTRF